MNPIRESGSKFRDDYKISDVNINDMVTSLLENPYCNKDEILAFQHEYRSLMNIEINNLRRGMTQINSVCAKERRFIKAISVTILIFE